MRTEYFVFLKLISLKIGTLELENILLKCYFQLPAYIYEVLVHT